MPNSSLTCRKDMNPLVGLGCRCFRDRLSDMGNPQHKRPEDFARSPARRVALPSPRRGLPSVPRLTVPAPSLGCRSWGGPFGTTAPTPRALCDVSRCPLVHTTPFRRRRSGIVPGELVRLIPHRAPGRRLCSPRPFGSPVAITNLGCSTKTISSMARVAGGSARHLRDTQGAVTCYQAQSGAA
jgi:hypothetical protein